MMEPTLLEKYEALPEAMKAEVAHYIEFLLEKYTNAESALQKKSEQPHGYGSWAGDIMMSDDFDEPLEDLKDYM